MQPDIYGSVKRRVSYFYDPEIGNYHYGQGHPMKVSIFKSPLMVESFLKNFFVASSSSNDT
jgi:hypothetical protein